MFTRNNFFGICLLFTTIIFFVWYLDFPVHRSASSLVKNYDVDQPIKRPLTSTFIHIKGAIKQLGNAKQMYIINLPFRDDRRTGSIALFQRLNFDAFIVSGYTISSSQVRSRFYLTKKNPIRLVEIACWASHFQLWLEVASLSNDTWILIFEDDLDLELSTLDILQSFPLNLWNTPDLIHLGHCGNAPGPFIYKGLHGFRMHQALHPGCTHAYAIRSSSARKLISFLSSPTKPFDDMIIDLVDQKKLLVYSIHPPLAVQQLNTSIRRADVSPNRNCFLHQIKTGVNFLFDTWTGVERVFKVKNSTLAQADLIKANEWRKKHENEFWKKIV